MTLSDTDAQTLILRKVGDVDPVTGDPVEYGLVSIAGVVGASMALLWSSHADKAQVTPRLRELYVERDAYDLILGCLSALVDYTLEGETVKLSQRVAFIQKRRDNTQAEIVALQTVALNRRVPAIGPILTVEPISPPTSLPAPSPFGPSANDPMFSGSPYAPSIIRRSQ
jgi:hypothetical protein